MTTTWCSGGTQITVTTDCATLTPARCIAVHGTTVALFMTTFPEDC